MPFAIGFRIPDVIAIQPVDEHVASQIEEVDGRRRHRHFGDLISLSNHDDFVRSRSLAPCDPCSLQCRRLRARKGSLFREFALLLRVFRVFWVCLPRARLRQGLTGTWWSGGWGNPPPGGLSGGLRTRQYRWSRLTVEQGSFLRAKVTRVTLCWSVPLYNSIGNRGEASITNHFRDSTPKFEEV